MNLGLSSLEIIVKKMKKNINRGLKYVKQDKDGESN